MAGNKLKLHVAGDLIMFVAIVIAVILGGHILFVFLEANPGNDIVQTDSELSHWLGTWFRDMFTPDDYKLNVLLNYGLAAVVYLLVGAVLRRVVNGMQR